MRGLDDRTYIVTGAASGIGRATAARLLEEGARVVGADLVEANDAPGGSQSRISAAADSDTSTWPP